MIENNKKVENALHLEDGIYDTTGIDFISIEETNISEKEITKFIKKYPNFCVASAYDTYTTLLLSKKPKELDNNWQTKNIIGSGFNYGSTNILTNCPKSILILAEND
jgi:hypothetical protein